MENSGPGPGRDEANSGTGRDFIPVPVQAGMSASRDKISIPVNHWYTYNSLRMW